MDKSNFLVQGHHIYLGHCGISPLYSGAAERMKTLIDYQSRHGDALFADHYMVELRRFKELMSQFLNASPDDFAVTRNTTEGMSMIANGYPFEPGDEIILYELEYPANFYPWINLQSKGVVIRTLRNHPHEGMTSDSPGQWIWSELEDLVTERTRMIVMSHVQFVSGYASDLEQLSRFCKDRRIDLILDAAQSLGVLPLDLEKTPVAAMAASGWKWMLGPVGIAPFYTSREMREKVALTVVGAETMVQGTDFLNHEWNPHPTARRYEYSTSPVYQVAGFNQCLEDLFLVGSQSEKFQRLLHLQDLFLKGLNHPDFTPLKWPVTHRSGILSLRHPDCKEVAMALEEKGVKVTARSGFIRVAPQFYNTEEEIAKAVEAFNSL